MVENVKVKVLHPLDTVSDGRHVFVDLKPGDIVNMPGSLFEKLAKNRLVAPIDSLVEPDVQEFLESTVRSEITSIEVKCAREVYGKNAIEPDRETIVMQAKNGARLVTSLPRGVKYENGKWIVTEREEAKKFLKNKASKFGAFLRKYGCWPHVGNEVDTLINGNGIGRVCIAEVEKPNSTPKAKNPARKKSAPSQRRKPAGRK